METNNSSDDNITLKEFLTKIQEYAHIVWMKKIYILAICIVFFMAGASKALTSSTTFTASVSFMVNEDDGTNVGGFGDILGQFGFNGGGSEYNLAKIVELARSRRIIESVLLDTSTIDGNKNSIANHIINTYQLREKWERTGSQELKDFRFLNSDPSKHTKTEKLIMKTLYGLVVGNLEKRKDGFVKVRYNEETGILKIISKTESEELSARLSEVLYYKLSNFYILKSTQKQRDTFEKISSKVDSIQGALNNSEYKLARFKDGSLDLLRNSDNIERSQLSRNVQVLTLLYGEALKNRETASFVLNNKTPFFQMIDGVFYPLFPQRPNVVTSGIKWSILGAFIASLIFIMLKIYKEIMS